MALVPSTFILSVGSKAPDFSLTDSLSGDTLSYSDIKGDKGTLVVFACNHCPYVVHLAKQLGEFASRAASHGVKTVAISANDIENYPQDAPEKMKTFATESGWDFPYLFDSTQEVAHAYSAACTPDFFLFDSEGVLYYAGQFDESRPNDGAEITGSDLKDALKKMVLGETYESPMKPATGCNIKWKPGNEPKYFG